MGRPSILYQKEDSQRLMDQLGVKYDSWYIGSSEVLRVKNEKGEYNIIKMFPDYRIFNSFVKSLGCGTAIDINSEVRVLDKMEQKGFDTPRIIRYGNFKCEETKDLYKYLVKEYIPGKSWHVGMSLNADQLKELGEKVKTFHSSGFANFDLVPGNKNVNVLIGEDSHIHLFDMNLVKEKSRISNSMFQKYKSVDSYNLEQIIKYNSQEFLEKYKSKNF